MLDQLKYYVSLGWSVHLVTDVSSGNLGLPNNSQIDVLCVPMRRDISPLKDCKAFVLWLVALRTAKPDVVIVGTPKAALLGLVAAKFLNIRFRVYHCRGLRFESLNGWKRRIAYAAEWLTCRSSTSCIANSYSLRDELVKTGLMQRDRIYVLGNGSSNGVNTNRFHPPSRAERTHARSELGIVNGDFVIGFVGRIHEDKGLKYLFEAVRHLRLAGHPVKLLVVGDSDYAPRNMDSFTSFNDSDWFVHVPFTGPEELYWAMDVFCLPSLREGFPNVVLEAGAAGLPVVTTLSTGCRDSVIHLQTGLLVDTGDSQAIAEALRWLLMHPDQTTAMGKENRRWVSENFDQLAVWKAHQLHLESLVSSRC